MKIEDPQLRSQLNLVAALEEAFIRLRMPNHHAQLLKYRRYLLSRGGSVEVPLWTGEVVERWAQQLRVRVPQ
jgi:hypothetical protein